MNKYIRTKNRIIDLSTVTIGENGWKNIKEYVTFKIEEQKEPIKQADTIEELCDEFVVVGYSICEKPMLILGNQYPLKVAKNYLKCSEVIYGSIWVDGNLIKVAKLNDKGELELL